MLPVGDSLSNRSLVREQATYFWKTRLGRLADLTRPGRLDDSHPAGSSGRLPLGRVGWPTSPGRVVWTTLTRPGLPDDSHSAGSSGLPPPAGSSWLTSPGRVVRTTPTRPGHLDTPIQHNDTLMHSLPSVTATRTLAPHSARGYGSQQTLLLIGLCI